MVQRVQNLCDKMTGAFRNERAENRVLKYEIHGRPEPSIVCLQCRRVCVFKTISFCERYFEWRVQVPALLTTPHFDTEDWMKAMCPRVWLLVFQSLAFLFFHSSTPVVAVALFFHFIPFYSCLASPRLALPLLNYMLNELVKVSAMAVVAFAFAFVG